MDFINLKIRLENVILVLYGMVIKEICNILCNLWYFEGFECFGFRLWIVYNVIGWYLMGKFYFIDKKVCFLRNVSYYL